MLIAPDMADTHANAMPRRGLAKKPYSAGLGILGLSSQVISALAGALLAFDLLGYHAPGHLPHPKISILLLALGLSLAVVGQLLGAGRNEGIRVRGWVGIFDVLHLRLTLAGLAFLSGVVHYAWRGKPIRLYPVGILTIISGFFLVSRLLAKFVFHIDRRRRAGKLEKACAGQ